MGKNFWMIVQVKNKNNLSNNLNKNTLNKIVIYCQNKHKALKGAVVSF